MHDDEPLSPKSIRYRLATLIEVTALPLYSVSQAEDLLKNIHTDLIRIKASLDPKDPRHVNSLSSGTR